MVRWYRADVAPSRRFRTWRLLRSRGERVLGLRSELLLLADPLLRLPRALAGQPRLDRDATHQRESGDPQERPPGIRHAVPALELGEAAHDRAGVALDREPRRDHDLEAAHDRGQVQLGDAGR